MNNDIILWNNIGTSDKIWGVAEYQGQHVTFWGKRGHELRFKLLGPKEDPQKLIRKKLTDRDYHQTTFVEMEDLKPGFKSEFDQMLLMCILGDAYYSRGDGA